MAYSTPPVDPVKCRVYGYLKGLNDGVVSPNVVIYLNKKYVKYGEWIIQNIEIPVSVDTNGRFEVELISNTGMEDNTYYIMKINDKCYHFIVDEDPQDIIKNLEVL